jgi:hypothetical protein
MADTTPTSFSARVAVQAAELRPLRIVLTVLAVPFYLFGVVLGLLFVAALWAVGAVRVGLDDARARLAPPAPVPPIDAGGD